MEPTRKIDPVTTLSSDVFTQQLVPFFDKQTLIASIAVSKQWNKLTNNKENWHRLEFLLQIPSHKFSVIRQEFKEYDAFVKDLIKNVSIFLNKLDKKHESGSFTCIFEEMRSSITLIIGYGKCTKPTHFSIKEEMTVSKFHHEKVESEIESEPLKFEGPFRYCSVEFRLIPAKMKKDLSDTLLEMEKAQLEVIASKSDKHACIIQ